MLSASKGVFSMTTAGGTSPGMVDIAADTAIPILCRLSKTWCSASPSSISLISTDTSSSFVVDGPVGTEKEIVADCSWDEKTSGNQFSKDSRGEHASELTPAILVPPILFG